MKRLFRWGFRLLLALLVLIVALLLVKDALLKALAERRIRQQTGFDVQIARLEVGLLSPTFTMEGFKLYNPPEFGGSVLLDVPEVRFEYDPRLAARRKLHLNSLRFHLNELHVVRNQQGHTNLFGLVSRARSRSAGPTRPTAERAAIEFGGIDRLYLTLGTLRYTDQKAPQNNRLIELGWKDRPFRIRDRADLTNLVGTILMEVTVKALLSRPVGTSGPASPNPATRR